MKKTTKKRPRGRGADPEATREALVAAATALFAEKGYDGATVEEIGARAGANKASINYHFDGKTGLYRAVLEGKAREVAARVRGVLAEERPADALLRDYMAAFAGAVSDHPQIVPLLVREMLDGGRRLDEKVLPHFLAVLGTVREIVERGMREKAFRDVNPLAIHLSVVGSLLFFFLTGPFRQRLAASGRLPVPMPSPEAFVSELQRLVSIGLGAAEPRTAVRRPRRK
jgi:TetR/AcrR family transcriptional regulator